MTARSRSCAVQTGRRLLLPSAGAALSALQRPGPYPSPRRFGFRLPACEVYQVKLTVAAFTAHRIASVTRTARGCRDPCPGGMPPPKYPCPFEP
ncbi:hypothetical protein QF030_001629 [Streptomyces rishiriensis]|uniref:Secreted protein n=1 Tax=Streptomyces rishiriensis TaxID=68264 RepID=A0ABU0NK41_STRRH|nr:hypothetical protein [Streptomyces rishiriensis]